MNIYIDWQGRKGFGVSGDEGLVSAGFVMFASSGKVVLVYGDWLRENASDFG